MEVLDKRKLLFVCTINRMRSATAHKIYENDSRFEVKSAKTEQKPLKTCLKNSFFAAIGGNPRKIPPKAEKEKTNNPQNVEFCGLM